MAGLGRAERVVNGKGHLPVPMGVGDVPEAGCNVSEGDVNTRLLVWRIQGGHSVEGVGEQPFRFRQIAREEVGPAKLANGASLVVMIWQGCELLARLGEVADRLGKPSSVTLRFADVACHHGGPSWAPKLLEDTFCLRECPDGHLGAPFGEFG